MKQKNINKLLLFLIVSIGFFLRVYSLESVPFGFHRDEAYLGYNAYSLLLTGKDINGNFLPIHFESFLFSPGIYSYVSIPFIFLFGLNIFSVRFASVFFGTITILALYGLVGKIFTIEKNNKTIALFSSFFLAISPWHIIVSRTATENVIAVFLFIVALYYFFLYVENKKERFHSLFYLINFISLFVYQSPRAFLPIFIPVLLYFYRKKINIKISIGLFLLIVIIPIVCILQSKELSLRVRTVSIFNAESMQLVVNEKIREDGVVGLSTFLTRVFHNKLLGYSSVVITNYMNHYSYNFLFTDQILPERYRIPQQGLLYLFQLPFLFYGLYMMLKKNQNNLKILLFLLLAIPIGSAFTADDVPNLQRTLLFAPFISIITALGIVGLFDTNSKKMLLKNVYYSIIGIIIFFSCIFFIHSYFFHVNWYKPWIRNDGYHQLVDFLLPYESKKEKIIVTNRESAPTIFFLFYSRYDPFIFQKYVGIKKSEIDWVSFGKYIFTEEECPLTEKKLSIHSSVNKLKNIIVVNSGNCDALNNFKEIREIKRYDGSIAFRVYEQ